MNQHPRCDDQPHQRDSAKEEQEKWDVDKPMHTNEDIHEILTFHGMAEKWRDYLTVLSVRNYGQTAKDVLRKH